MARVAVAGSGTGRCKALMRSSSRLFNDLLFKGLAGLQDEERQRSVDGRNEYERSKAVVVAFFREWHGSALATTVCRSNECGDCCVSWLDGLDRVIVNGLITHFLPADLITRLGVMVDFAG